MTHEPYGCVPSRVDRVYDLLIQKGVGESS